MRKTLTVLLLLCVCVGLGLGYRLYSRHRDLKETVVWVDLTYNPHDGGDNFGRGHGWEKHYVQDGQVEKLTENFNTTFTSPSTCTMVIRSETAAEGIYRATPSLYTYTLNLGDIDPSTIIIKTWDLHKDVFDCADPEQVKMYQLQCDNAEVEFRTRNGAAAISEEGVKTFLELTGTDNESKTSTKTNKAWLVVDDVPYAQRLAKALKHAVELCGGTVSKF
jgi:hypothetical protein